MPGLEYLLVLALTFGAGVSVGKKCKHKKHNKRRWIKHNRQRHHKRS